MFKSSSLNVNHYYALLLLCFPLFYIIGSLFLNIAIVAISLIYFFNYSKINYDKKIVFFFFLIFVYFLINSIFSENKFYSFYKSTAYFRYLFFIFGLLYLLLNINRNLLKSVSKLFIFLSILLVIDIAFEFFYGKDIFGNSGANYNRISGPFGDELIVGFFLLYFGFSSWGLFLKFYKVDKKIYYFLFPILIIYTVYITGERNAFYSSLIFLSFLVIFDKNFRKVTSLVLITILILFYVSNKYNVVNNKYSLESIIQIKNNVNEKQINKTNSIDKIPRIILNSHWVYHYRSAFEIFKTSPIIGSGFKTFRIACHSNENSKKYFCSTHPHNIYFELLSDTGVIGLLFFLTIIFYPIIIFFRNINNLDFSSKIFFALFLTYIFPFKPHGSLFTTSFATLLWFLYTLNLYSIKNDRNK